MVKDIYTANNTKIDWTQGEETIARLIWEEGFRTKDDHHQFKQQAPFHHIAHQIVQDLERAKLLHTGFSLPYENYNQDLTPATIDYHSLVQNNQTLVKLIYWWDCYMQQTSEYNIRPALRLGKNTHATHKLDLKTNQIIPYQLKRRQKTNYTHTKKQSTTALSKHLHTSLFRDGVGLMFDESKCDVRAMFRQNAVTVCREWVGSEWSVKFYKWNQSKNLMTDRHSFRRSVDEQSWFNMINNEVLAKLSREAILGVFISGASTWTKAEAIRRQQELKTKFNIDCPIFIYSSFYRSLRVYSLREQQEDMGVTPRDLVTANNQLLNDFKDVITAGNTEKMAASPLIRRFEQEKWLVFAANNNDVAVINLLLSEGCNVDQADKNQQTALMNAVRCNHKDVVRVLLNSGADITLANNKDQTVFDIALKQGHQDVLEMLLLHAIGIEDDEVLITKHSSLQLQSIFTQLIDEDHVDGVMALLLLDVANLVHSFDASNPNHAPAIAAATTLHGSLQEAFDKYRQAGSQSDDRALLYEEWQEALNQAKTSELANHRHWRKKVCTHLSLFLVTVGVGYLAVGIATLYQTGGQRFFFQTNTRSMNHLLDVESHLQQTALLAS